MFVNVIRFIINSNVNGTNRQWDNLSVIAFFLNILSRQFKYSKKKYFSKNRINNF